MAALGLVAAVQKHFEESARAKQAGDANWWVEATAASRTLYFRWKIHESVFLCLGSVKDLLVGPNAKKVQFDINVFLNDVVLADLAQSGTMALWLMLLTAGCRLGVSNWTVFMGGESVFAVDVAGAGAEVGELAVALRLQRPVAGLWSSRCGDCSPTSRPSCGSPPSALPSASATR